MLSSLLRIVLTGCFFVSLIGGVYLLDEQGMFEIESIQVHVDIDDSAVRMYAPYLQEVEEVLNELMGQSLWRLSVDHWTSLVSDLQWVERAQLRRRWPGELEVELVVKNVELLIVGVHGAELFPVLGDGAVLEPIETGRAPDAPLLRGEIFLEDELLRSRALALLRELPQTGSFSRVQVSELGYHPIQGFWVQMVQGGVRVQLGQDKLGARTKRVAQVLDYLEAHSFKGRVIDANFSKKVLVRLRKGLLNSN